MLTTITARLAPCRCGCHGADPWHARTFRRLVSDIAPTYTAIPDYCGMPGAIITEGTVKLPGSGGPQRVLALAVYHDRLDRWIPLGWYLEGLLDRYTRHPGA